jgi:formylglycine-generating enzyme required for sulfatase activity
MAGNVWEWCRNEYDDSGESRRLLRGGSWNYRRDLARAAYRFHYHPGSRNYNFGLRLVRVSPIFE